MMEIKFNILKHDEIYGKIMYLPHIKKIMNFKYNLSKQMVLIHIKKKKGIDIKISTLSKIFQFFII